MSRINQYSRIVIRSAIGLLAMSLIAVMSACAATSPDWGTYNNLFAATSLWNSRPVAPTFGTFVIPTSSYYPSVGGGAWSTGVFLTSATDGPMTISGIPNSQGLWDPDAEVFHNVTLPHWPANVIPATAADGHADIVDPVTGIVHSFWQLKNNNGQWVAAQYAWSSLTGSGWGDPAHYYQGARATGVPTAAGLIRLQEVNDGDVMYHHALAMSLTNNALSANPTYIFPATSADGNAATTNTGTIPEGALLMLPPSFDTQRITSLPLRKVAETLKAYGAYVVDRNVGTPYFIYVENGGHYDLMNGKSWDSAVAAQLDLIRSSLRQVVSTQGWIDGNGQNLVLQKKLNLLSMRGAWQLQSGATAGVFNTWQQAVVFPVSATPIVQVNYSSRGLNAVTWALPQSGATYTLTAIATGGAKLRLQVRDKSTSVIYFDSGELGNGQTKSFVWPANTSVITVYAISGVGLPSTIRGTLVQS